MIYCVEDDRSIRELIVYTLNISGFEAEGFEDAGSFFAALKQNRPQLIMLDIMLPDKSGLQILNELKNDDEYRDIPVIMETAKTTEFDKVIGLDSGADDYLSKPFGMMEMVSRVKAVLRRNSQPVSEELAYRGIRMDPLRRSVTVDGEPVELTLKEFELLRCFINNPGIVFSREQLLDKVWGTSYLGESRTIDVHIGTLRSKIREYGNDIRTVHGVGYSLKEGPHGQ
ncbi:MAG: response regulator transcription factor [Erysipelotrichaceae bacterium]|nr:response regulator transcription factor [Erysipelotrichaceae bacterium]